MSWVTVIWSATGGVSLTLALIQFFVWWKDRAARASLAFAVLAVAVAIFAAVEVALMRAQTPEQFGTTLRWLHVPLWGIFASVVVFVHLYLRAGRRWLAWAVMGVRTLSLVLNFIFWPNINFREIAAVRQVSFLGEPVSVGKGLLNPWMLFAQFGSLLLIIYVADAAMTAWRRGDRRQAVTVGGGILFFAVVGSIQGLLIASGVISMPVTITLFYLPMVATMAYELSYGLVRAAALSRQLQVSQVDLRESEERMSLATHAAGLIVWTWDIQRDEVWLSNKDRVALGFSATEKLTADRVRTIVHPEDREFLRQLVEKSLATGTELNAEYRIVLPDGKVRSVQRRGRIEFDQTGKPICERGVLMDITERRQAEEKFRLAVEASPSGIVLVDAEGKIALVNSLLEKLSGYQREELVGRPVEMLVPQRFAAQHPGYRGKFVAAPETRAMGAGRELFARRKDGSEFQVEIGLNPIETPDGILVLANVVDISARIAAEEEARRRRDQVELLGRVSLLGEMTASLAHELNQPLAAIMNNAAAAMNYIERSRLEPEILKDILGDVMADGRRASDIMRNVRNAIKKGSAIRGRINLNHVVESVTRMLQADAAANFCKVETSLAPDLPPIEGDPTQLQQVMVNLIRNAFEAMRNTPPNCRAVEITTKYNGRGGVSVAVRDHGCGISEAMGERLFEQFFTTKQEGLGMGLAIVRSIIESHGGTITAENADRSGARFHFHLPSNEELTQG